MGAEGTPVVSSTGLRFQLNMLSVVNHRGGNEVYYLKNKMNGGVVCRFLDHLMVGRSKPIFLLWDSHPAHKLEEVAEKIRSYEGKLRVHRLRGDSPGLNPTEGVWREVKSHRFGRAGVFNCANEKSKRLGALRLLARRSDKIRNLFHIIKIAPKNILEAQKLRFMWYYKRVAFYVFVCCGQRTKACGGSTNAI